MGHYADDLSHDEHHAARIHTDMMSATVEMGADAHYRVRLRSGRLVRATCDAGVCPDLVDACIRDRRRMLVERDGDALFIVGALQTSLKQEPTSAPEHLRLEGKEELTLRAGNSTLTLRADGHVMVRGNHLTMDLARLVKILAAKVELP